MAGEQLGAADDNDKLEQIRPSRWSQGAVSRCTLAALALLQPLSASLAAQVVLELAMAANLLLQASVRAGYVADWLARRAAAFRPGLFARAWCTLQFWCLDARLCVWCT